MQTELPGTGHPLFAFRNIMRLRRALEQSLCSHCGERITGESVLFPFGKAEGEIFVFSDTPLHPACALMAARLCPHIREMGAHALPTPDKLQSRVIEREHEGQRLLESYALVMPMPAFDEWRYG